MSKLVLIDGHAIMHRAYHALPPLTTKDKKPINAVYGLVSMLLRIIKEMEPTHIAVAFDRKEPTFRKEAFEEYQAHRPEMDEELDEQFERARQTLRAFNVPIYSKAGYEADDVIGTLAKNAEKDMDEVVIVTGDQDILQLVGGSVKVFLPSRGVVKGKVYEKDDVVEKLKIEPEQIVDYKALAGDSSDNYPGIRGVGPKTAAKLLEEYGDLDEIYKNLDKIEDSLRKKLEENKKDVVLYRKLARIVTNVELEDNLEKARAWKVDDPEVIGLFEEYGFKTLKKRVKSVGKEIEKKRQGKLFSSTQ